MSSVNFEQNPTTNYEEKHKEESEPWSYSDRAAEILRHQWIATMAARFDPQNRGVLDVGCSFGQLSSVLYRKGLNLTSIDISETAASKTKDLLSKIKPQSNQPSPKVFTGTATKLPFADNSFQVVLFSDGLIGWELTKKDQLIALNEAHRVLESGGTLVTTDYLHSKYFEAHLETFKQGPLKILETHYLNDRLWFQLNTNLEPLKKFSFIRSFLRNTRVAKGLAKISSLMGAKGSKHLAVILQKI